MPHDVRWLRPAHSPLSKKLQSRYTCTFRAYIIVAAQNELLLQFQVMRY